MVADILILTVLFAYSAFIIYRVVRGKMTGEGSPFSCSGNCQGCGSVCRTPEQQEKLYQEIRRSMEEAGRR
ncbi:MAG: FeoB-associated Cys-rich membrane protein [Firmicutes bacterium]|nr:FeoB-associated Cys-rich membrane protein [Bacillota bacterium]